MQCHIIENIRMVLVANANLYGYFSGLPDQLQPVDILQPLIYVAAELGAMEFIDIIYSLSAGRIVLHAYKNDDVLPEDIAEENGHEEIAAYLREITKRCVIFLHKSSTEFKCRETCLFPIQCCCRKSGLLR